MIKSDINFLSYLWPEEQKMIYDNDIIVPPASPIRRSYSKDMNGTGEIPLLTCAHVEVILESRKEASGPASSNSQTRYRQVRRKDC